MVTDWRRHLQQIIGNWLTINFQNIFKNFKKKSKKKRQITKSESKPRYQNEIHREENLNDIRYFLNSQTQRN